MVHSRPLILGLAAALLATAPAAHADRLHDVLATTAPDSLAPPLRRLEATSIGTHAGEVAWVLGQLHYARGEYRQAAGAFARAAARLEPARKGAARYWLGLSWLGAGDATQARVVLEEVARTEPAYRAAARLGIAFTWELTRRPERALEELDRLTTEGAGDAMPAALEREAALAGALHRDDLAGRARTRLLREWPTTVEATRLRDAPVARPDEVARVQGTVAVQIGAFADRARAQSLADAARRAGFANVQVVERREGPSTIHLVRIGAFADAETARKAGERAAAELGVGYQVVRP